MEFLSQRLEGALEAVSDTGPRVEALLLRHGPFIRRIVSRLCPDHLGIDRSEVEQQASIRLWRVVEHQREIRDFESYIYRVVATATLDAIRLVKARMEDQLVIEHAEALTGSPALPGSRAQSPEEMTWRRDLIEKVTKLIERFPPPQQRVIKLYLQGFTSEEIGRLLGWSEPKARNITYRALKDLRASAREAGLNDDR